MESTSDLVGNSLTLLIERVFWLIIGVFFGISLITSFIRTIKEKKFNEKIVTPKELEKLASKAIRKKYSD